MVVEVSTSVHLPLFSVRTAHLALYLDTLTWVRVGHKGKTNVWELEEKEKDEDDDVDSMGTLGASMLDFILFSRTVSHVSGFKISWSRWGSPFVWFSPLFDLRIGD